MAVGYIGIIFQDVGSVTQSLRNFHEGLVTYKSLGHYWKALALGYYRSLGMVHKKRQRQNVWSMIIIKPSSPYFCSRPWIGKFPGGNLTSIWTFYEPGFYRICRFCKSFLKLDETGETNPQPYLQSPLLRQRGRPLPAFSFTSALLLAFFYTWTWVYFFPYCTSMRNPLDCDRPLSVWYIHIPTWLQLFILLFSHYLAALILRPLGITPLKSFFRYHLIAQQTFPFFLIFSVPLKLPLRSSFPTSDFCAPQKL